MLIKPSIQILLTQSRELVEEMPWTLEKTIDTIAQNNLDLTNERQSVIVGDAPGGDSYVIMLIDLVNADEVIIPIEVFGAYGSVRNKTVTGKNYVTDGDFLYRDKHMAKKCHSCIACWNGEWKNGIIGRSGTVTTAKYVTNIFKPVTWSFVEYSFRNSLTL